MYLKDYVDINYGIQLTTMKNGEIESEQFVNADSETMFQACSMSKPVAAMMTLILCEQGILDLDTTIDEYIGKNGFSFESVTLRELLSHSSGTNVHGYIGYKRSWKIPSDSKEIIKKVKVIPEKKGNFSYSGGGYQIVQYILETMTSKPFETLADELIFKKLGMKNTTFKTILKKGEHNIAEGHGSKSNAAFFFLFEKPFMIHPEKAAAGLWTTASDYAKFMMATMTEKSDGGLLTQSMLDQVTKDHANAKRGLGWFLPQENTIEHGGANLGYRCSSYYEFDTKCGYVLMTSSETHSNYVAMLKIQKSVIAELKLKDKEVLNAKIAAPPSGLEILKDFAIITPQVFVEKLKMKFC